MKKIFPLIYPCCLVLLFALSSCAQASSGDVPGKFVFSSNRAQTQRDSVFLYEGGKTTLLKKDADFPAFSPDGKTIACRVETGIVLLDEKGNQIDFFPTVPWPGKTAWAPDGKSFLYSVGNPAGKGYLLRKITLSDRSDEVFLDLKESIAFLGFAYSPDGSKILVHIYADKKELTGLYLCDSDGTNLHQLLQNGISVMWFSDSKHIAFHTNFDEQGNKINEEYGALFKMNVDTGQITKIIDLKFDSIAPEASKIGLSHDDKFFYLSKPCPEGNSYNIVIRPLDDPSKEIEVTPCQKLGNGIYSQDSYPDWHRG